MPYQFRAAYWISDDRQGEVLLTTYEERHLSDDDLMAAALAEAARGGVDLTTGEIVIGEWRENDTRLDNPEGVFQEGDFWRWGFTHRGYYYCDGGNFRTRERAEESYREVLAEMGLAEPEQEGD